MTLRILLTVFTLLIVSCVTTTAQISWTKHPANPVLTPGILNGVGPSGIEGSFDSRYALSPSIIVHNNTYKMWYVGFESYWTGRFTIGYALSDNEFIWNTYTKNPILTPSLGQFDGQHVWLSVVIVADEGIRMYYSGTNGSGWRVGIASSTDGVHWIKYSSNPVLDIGPPGSWDNNSVWGVSVIRVGPSEFRMWFSGAGSDPRAKIGYATSRDGIRWTKYSGNPVLIPGPAGSWEAQNVYVPRVIYARGVFHMFYLGNEGSRTQIGYAYSSDGIHWTKYSSNPVLKYGQPGEWDSYTLIDHDVVFQDSTFKIWYGGRDNSIATWQIGLATSRLSPIGVLGAPSLPEEYNLYQSFPNPFNPETEIRFDIPKVSHVILKVFNNLGQEIAILVDEQKTPGQYSAVWNPKNVASGTYWCRMTAGEFSETRKMVLLK